VSTTQASERFTALPDDETLEATVVALEEHGSSVEVVDDLDAARETALARIPEGSAVMTNTSVTLDETGIAEAINDGGPYESLRDRTSAAALRRVGRDVESALASGEVRGTPTLFIDGVVHRGGYRAADLLKVLAR
jgi:glutaredoxin